MVASTLHPRPSIGTVVSAYVALTKPRIIELLLVTTVPTMVVADGALPSLWLMLATVIGGTLAAGGANAINMYVDRDIDALMERTKGRPLVTGVIVTPLAALTFAIALEVVAFVWLWALRQPALRRAGPVRLPLLRVRVHAVAQAHLEAEHRHRRRRPAPSRS